MSDWALMTDPVTGKVGFFLQNGSSGAQDDPNSTRNLPLNNPASYLANILFHPDLDYLEVAAAGSIGITHAAITGNAAQPGFAASFGWDAGSDDQLLVTHGLGYEPFAIVAAGGNILWSGMPVQNNSDGGARWATAYCSTTALRLFTQATIGTSNLSSTTITYEYIVFKVPATASGHILIDFDPTTGVVTLGLGKFHSDAPYLQVTPGGSPLALALGGKTIDLNNGAPKAWRADGTTYAPVPSGLKSFLPFQDYTGLTDFGGEPLGASMAYGGSYAGPTGSVDVQAP